MNEDRRSLSDLRELLRRTAVAAVREFESIGESESNGLSTVAMRDTAVPEIREPGTFLKGGFAMSESVRVS